MVLTPETQLVEILAKQSVLAFCSCVVTRFFYILGIALEKKHGATKNNSPPSKAISPNCVTIRFRLFGADDKESNYCCLLKDGATKPCWLQNKIGIYNVILNATCSIDYLDCSKSFKN